MMTTSIKRKRRESGQSIVESALLVPWIFFLFVGVFDLGLYAYGAICTQNAARAAAIQTAASVGSFYQSDNLACTAVLNELSLMPNVVSVASCGAKPVQVTRRTLCDSSKVSYVTCDAADDSLMTPATAPSTAAGWPASSQVSVTYTYWAFIPIPFLNGFNGKMVITRIAQARIINE